MILMIDRCVEVVCVCKDFFLQFLNPVLEVEEILRFHCVSLLICNNE